MRVLLTNDDGIEATGINVLRRELAKLPDVDLRVVAPDGNRSAMARSITTRRPLWVSDVQFDDGSTGYATDGTPVDCVRLAHLGLIEGWRPEMVVAGINHGTNIGDDITYSGTVAAALEGVILGLPSIALSQQSRALETDYRLAETFDFGLCATLAARLIAELDSVPLPRGTLLNVNVPGRDPAGIAVARLGRRFYDDALELVASDEVGRRRFRVYGEAMLDSGADNADSDVALIARGYVALTPVHFDLTYEPGIESLSRHDFGHLLADLVR
jgi:5'-nucleotidase